MSNEQEYPTLADRFAVAMAIGQSVSAWARKNGVPRQTCHEWQETQEHKTRVQAIRRRAIDRASGQLAHDFTQAAGRLGRLARKGKTEYVQVQAARAVLKELIVVRKHADLEDRMCAIESDLRDHGCDIPER